MGEQREEGYFLSFHRNEGFKGVAAEGTELQGLAASAAQAADAGFAQDFTAVGATMGGLGLRMAPAENGPVGQEHGRRFDRALDFGDGNPGIGGFDKDFDVAEAHRLAGMESGFPDGLGIEEGAVGGIAVAQEYAIGGEDDFAMDGRDGGMVDGKFAVGMPTETICTQVQVDSPRFAAVILYQQSCHTIPVTWVVSG